MFSSYRNFQQSYDGNYDNICSAGVTCIAANSANSISTGTSSAPDSLICASGHVSNQNWNHSAHVDYECHSYCQMCPFSMVNNFLYLQVCTGGVCVASADAPTDLSGNFAAIFAIICQTASNTMAWNWQVYLPKLVYKILAKCSCTCADYRKHYEQSCKLLHVRAFL